MATLVPTGLGPNLGNVSNLQTAQTGNADSTNTIDRGGLRTAALLQINATAGATPTVTVNILGSMDGTNFFNVAYATTAAPETVAVAALVLTATAVTQYILRPNQPWRFLKLNMSANTNMTLTSDLYLNPDPYIT
jgi:hypothetical protein